MTITFQNSQEFCNFVVFAPTNLPKDCIVKEHTLRHETCADKTKKGSRSSLRSVFEGAGRTLIIKQFLYDWAPPAYDCPSLWRNDEIATTQESPPPKAIFIGNNVLWIGKNYRKQNGATIEIDRTRIEITLEKGDFTDQELIDLCNGFEPQNQQSRTHILNAPFSSLSYYARHLEKATRVPISYWNHQRKKTMYCFPLTHDEALTAKPSIHSFISTLKQLHYALNSGFAFGAKNKKEEPAEVEFLFEHTEHPGCFIRILASSYDSKNPIKMPPKIGDQECFSEIVYEGKSKYYYAHSLTCAHGPHEALFSIDSMSYMILVKPAPWTIPEWFLKLMKSII